MKRSRNLSTGVFDNTVENHLRTAYNVSATPQLIADWNWNRYANPTATNTVDESEFGFDIEAFPIESIVEPLRPSKGIAKALLGQAVVAPGYLHHHDPRFYTGDRDDTYKYWSKGPSGVDGVIASVKPRITYDRVVQANKIVIKFENTWATPDDWGVQVARTLTDGNATAFLAEVPGSSITIRDDGTAVLYYNGTTWVDMSAFDEDNSYVDHAPAFNPTTVSGVQLNIRSLKEGYTREGNVMGYYTGGTEDDWVGTDGSNSNFNLIAIEAHLEADLTNRLINVSDTFDFAEKSWLYPIGTITTNTAELTLSNEDGIFNAENEESIYHGLIEPNCEFDLKYIFTIDGVDHSVQQFKMYASQWSPGDAEVSVALEDYSKYLKEIKPRAFMVENKSSQELVWRILDSVGFVDYRIQDEDLFQDSVIPVFWTDGEQTVWEALDELAQATQTAIYFDQSGMLQVRTREAAYREDEIIDWTLFGEKPVGGGDTSGAELPDIINWSPSAEYEANKIEVKYQDAKWKVNSQGKPAMAKVWEPEGESLVVRSAALRFSMGVNEDLMYIDQKTIDIWPFDGMVQVDGEIMKYKGKQFVYYTYDTTTDPVTGKPTFTNEQKNYAIVNNPWAMRQKNRLTPPKRRHKNHYTGAFKVIERGLYNTEVADHLVDIVGWDAKVELGTKTGGTIINAPSGLQHNRKESLMTINTPPKMKNENDIFWATRGGVQSSGYKVYGTRIRFNKDDASPTQVAGICFNLSGAREAGYYFELRLTSSMTAKTRAVSSEVVTYSRVNGIFKKLDRGSATAVGKGIWYDIDVYKTDDAGQHRLTVFVNGHKVSTIKTAAATKHANTGQFGVYARGKTNVSFEYMYAVAYDDIKEPIDDYGFYDLKYGGVRGNQWLKEYVWHTTDRHGKLMERDSEKERAKRRNKFVFDEFGPYVHEVREFDVKFDPVPARYSYLFSTNEWYSTLVQYTGDPMGAKFIIANTSRDNAILHGEDNLIYAGASSGVNQVCVVLGQVLEVADEETITRENKSAIRARGEITAELSNRWIQSKSMATALADWMCTHWSDSIDQVDVEVFGNPLIELGDLVNVHFPRADVNMETHEYWVTMVNTSFENGITTNLTLRRRRPATDVS
jgi:hypothetical protein